MQEDGDDGLTSQMVIDLLNKSDAPVTAEDLQKLHRSISRRLEPIVTSQQGCSEAVTALQKRCTDIEQNASSRPAGSNFGGVDPSEMSAMKVELSKKDDQIRDLQLRQKEMYTAIGLVGAAVGQLNILVGLQGSIPADTADKLTANAYNNVINQINNNFVWPAEMKRAFYGSFQDIPAFTAEYKKIGDERA